MVKGSQVSAGEVSRQDQNTENWRDFEGEKVGGEIKRERRVEERMLVMVLTEKRSSIEYYYNSIIVLMYEVHAEFLVRGFLGERVGWENFGWENFGWEILYERIIFGGGGEKAEVGTQIPQGKIWLEGKSPLTH